MKENLLGLSFSLFFVVNTGIEETRTKKVKRKQLLKTLYNCQQSLWAALLLLIVVNFAIFFKHNLQVSCGGVWRVLFTMILSG